MMYIGHFQIAMWDRGNKVIDKSGYEIICRGNILNSCLTVVLFHILTGESIT